MRWSHRVSIAFVIAAIVAPPVAARTLDAGVDHLTLVTTAPDVTVTPGGVSLSGGDVASLSVAGRPVLPYRIVRVALPPGRTVGDVRVVASDPVVVARDVRLATGVAAAAEDGWTGPEVAPAAPAPDGTWPATPARYLGTGILHGVPVASFAVFPLRTRGGALERIERVEVTWSLRDAPGRVARRERRDPDILRRDAGRVRALVANPDAVAPVAVAPRPRRPGGFAPSVYPSLEGSAVEYVIVTPDSMASTFQVLADFKTAKGVPTVVRTLEWIRANARNGADEAETIRNFIVDAYAQWGIRYVLLGGDTEIVPARLMWSGFYNGGRFLAVDMYYGGLDGDWNADHDAVFGEFGVDAPDLYVEAWVGRLPAHTIADAALLISKIMNYERGVDRSYAHRSLFLGEVLFPSNYKPGDFVTLDGGDQCEFIRASTFTSPTLWTTRLYERYTMYVGSYPESRQAVLDSLDTGYNHVIHIGHGFRFNMSVGSESILNADAAALTNGVRQSNLYFLNCTAVALLYDCLGEAFLRNANGGAVSVIGANEVAFPLTSINYMYAYFSLVNQQQVVHLGEAFARSRESRTALALFADNTDFWTHYIYTLLGDPEMPLWTDRVDTLNVALPASISPGTSAVTITVSAGGVPVDSARVCLSKGADDYVVGTTDATGSVTLNFRAESAGSVSVVVTGLNHAMWEGAIPVTAPAPAYVSMASNVADDDSVGTSAGNGDGVIDAGETVDFAIAVTNSGQGAASNVQVVWRSTTFGVSILDSVATVGPVAPGATVDAADSIRVAFDPSMLDHAVAVFTVSVRDNGVEMWRDEVRREIHAPRIVNAGLRIDDTMGGNGDGIVDPGETFRLFYRIRNLGSGAWPGGTGVITALDTAFTIIDATDAWPAVSPFTDAENDSGMSIVESTTTSEHRLRLVVTDLYGRVWRDTLELRPPAPPDSIVIDPSLGPDRLELTWTAPPDSDVAGYHVYRSLTPGGPYTRVDVDAVAHTYLVDTGLSAVTRYYYVVTAVDASGNESAPSAEGSGSTSPAQQAGFPISMENETTSSPVVGDVDGDGVSEIVVGDAFVYVWHADGTEIQDGDDDPQTWGPINAEGGPYVSHIALARIDAQPGLDIVCASRDSQRVYVLGPTGAPLAGWPQAVENPIRAGLAVGDIDGDALLEVVAVDESGVVYAWNPDGTEVIDGDANPATPGVFFRLSGGGILHSSAPTLVDLDGDGARDVVVGSQADTLYALRADGSPLPGFPVALSADAAGSPAAGDIDGDGQPELVVVDAAGTVRALNADGTPLWTRWIVNTTFFSPSPALGDVDGDGRLETFFPASDGKLYGFDDDGTDLAGWPVTYATTVWTESSPIIVDVDGDAQPEIILGNEDRFIDAWHVDGSIVQGFPLATGDAMRGVPTAADVDGDGDVELVAAGWDRNTYVWDLPGAWSATASPWTGFHANRHNDGLYASTIPTAIAGVQFGATVTDGGVTLTFVAPSAAGQRFDVWRDALDPTGAVVASDVVAPGLALGPAGDATLRDGGVEPGRTYRWRLVDGAGETVYTSRAVHVRATRAALEAAVPNPFNPTTRIAFVVPEGAPRRVRLAVYDVRGARVRTLVDGPVAGGRHVVTWDGRDDRGGRAASGVYFYRMETSGFRATRKMVLLK